jgi:GT2 family glycosyltransferase
MMTDGRVSIVLLTHNRVDELARTLRILAQLPEQPPVIVVDNASRDHTVQFIERHFPQAELVPCHQNLGAAGRNAGVCRVRTPYVAFCDDDTWWAAGALSRAAELLDQHPRVAAVAARVLVGKEERTDPTCDRMAGSPLSSEGLPGPRLMSFMAGAVVIRTDAYREVGGYDCRLFLGAEEALMGLDLAARGWRIIYRHDVVSHHCPSLSRDSPQRRILLIRNRAWIAWMRLPLRDAMQETSRLLAEAAAGSVLRECLFEIAAGSAWVLRHRRVVPPEVAAMWRRIFGVQVTPSRRHHH